jgi:ring-1,2-phenylacetyl-CoA epoxidase subunit PaaE
VTTDISAPTAAGTTFVNLPVRSVSALTEDSVAVEFSIAPELREQFRHHAGQHVIVRRTTAEGEIRRTYSICTAADSDELKIGVRRIEGGALSTYLTTDLAAGSSIDVSLPTGEFGHQLLDPGVTSIGLVAVGSGITPLLSMAATHLRRSSETTVTLLLGNRSTSSTMFAEEIAALKDLYLDRLNVAHVMTREPRSSDLLNGRIDATHMSALLAAIIPHRDIDQWFLCGPMEAVLGAQEALESAGVSPERVHRELFYAEPTQHRSRPAPTGALVQVHLNGRTTDLEEADLSGTILDGLAAKRSDTPFSCRNGVCGTCKARCVSGEVSMDSTWALAESEIQDGVVLTCQARPVSDHVRLEFL